MAVSPKCIGQTFILDGALGARGIHELRSYRSRTLYDRNAYTIVASYHDGSLKLYPDNLSKIMAKLNSRWTRRSHCQ